MVNRFFELNENKLFYKSIEDFLNWLEKRSNNNFLFLDTETTGLFQSDPYDIQLTQISAVSCTYDFNLNKFKENDSFNKKIKLTDKTKYIIKNNSNSRIKQVLRFNHYGQNKNKYEDENLVLNDFLNWSNQYKNSIFIIQNAKFDMRMLNVRSGIKTFNNEVLDTKDLIQLYYIPCIQKLSEENLEYLQLINKIGTSIRDNGLISSSLSKIGPALNINMSNYHDALSDCRITITLLEKIVDFLKSNKNIDIRKYQLERIQVSF